MKMIIKRFLPIALAVIMVFAMMPAVAQNGFAAEEPSAGDINWSIDADGVLTITGQGAMKDYDADDAPWAKNKAKIKKVIIGDGITSVGGCAFYECEELTSVILPEGLKSIEYMAFHECTKLAEINLPEGLETIGPSAFYRCENLEDVDIPASVTSMGRACFQLCKKITKAVIPNGITKIIQYTFSGCSSLTDVTIPESVTSIGDFSFGDCTSLEHIDLPTQLEEINEGVFTRCANLKDIKLPETLKVLGVNAFRECSSLKEIYIPESVQNISYYCFLGCDALESIYVLEGSPADRSLLLTPYGSSKVKYVHWSGEHLIAEFLQKATCTEPGEKGTKCMLCDYKEYEVLEPTGHDWEEEYTVDVPATCIEEGKESIHCANCGMSDESTLRNVPMIEHDFQPKVTKATLKADGLIEYKCAYCGLLKSTEAITRIASVKLSKTKYIYDGSPKRPTVTAKDADGKKLAKDKDYTVTYSRPNAIGTCNVTIKFKGNYSGKEVLSFTIKPAKVTGLRLESPESRQLKVNWTVVGGGVKYRVAYRVKGTSTWKKTTVTSTLKRLKFLKGGKTYQVKVQAFKIVNGVEYRGVWSGIKSLKVKK